MHHATSLKVRGQAVEDFITSAQDRSKNAQEKSLQAAFAAWLESLRADQVLFESQKIMTLNCISKASHVGSQRSASRSHMSSFQSSSLGPSCQMRAI